MHCFENTFGQISAAVRTRQGASIEHLLDVALRTLTSKSGARGNLFGDWWADNRHRAATTHPVEVRITTIAAKASSLIAATAKHN